VLPDQGAIAAHLGMGRSTLAQKLKASPQLRQAYERGLGSRHASRVAAKRAVEPEASEAWQSEVVRDGATISAFIDEKLGLGIWGELRDECRQRLALELLTGSVRPQELTPAVLGKFIRRVRRDLGDAYRYVSFSSVLGEKIAAVLPG
jgi:hypothetical protein